MRLTLRTLLAYLDDTLEPTQIREIGSKVSQSGYAQALVDRIREVIRRRRLGAPDVSGPGMGLDPNTVSEYLDNTLEHGAVADVERICLESETHLAEVAASHQILALVLGEPVDVPSVTRERMYAIGPRPRSPANGSSSATGNNGVKSSQTTTATAVAPVTPVTVVPKAIPSADIESGVPDYLRPAPLWKRAAPVAIGLMVGIVWLSVIWRNDSNLSGIAGSKTPGEGAVVDASAPEDSTPTDSADASPAADATIPGGSVAGQSEPSTTIAQATIPETRPPRTTRPGSPAGSIASTAPRLPADQPPSAAATRPTATPMPPTATGPKPTEVASLTPPPAVPRPTAPATTPTTTTPTTTTPAPMPVTPVVPALPVPQVLYSSREGLFFRQVAEGWTALPHRSELRPGDRLACTEPYTATLEVESLGLTIDLHGGTAVEFLGTTADDALALAVLQGRVVLHRRDPESAIMIGLRLGAEDCHLELLPGQVTCGIEVLPREPHGFEVDLGQDRYSGNMFVTLGRSRLIDGQTLDEAVTAPAWLPLGPRDRRQLAGGGNRPPLLTTPDWLNPDGLRMSATMKRYALRFEKEVDLEQPLASSLPTLVVSTTPAISELATRCLAVTGNHELLVQALSRSEFFESREVAITALRQWLPQAPENRQLLKAELAMYFPADQVDALYRLLWGYDATDARNQGTARLLIDWMKHDSAVIRQLAFLHVYQMTGQKYDYRPVNPAAQRKAAMDRWESHLEKHGGALIE